MYVVYAIESRTTGRVYVGQSQDFDKRLKLHNSGHVISTSQDGPWMLVAMECFETRDQARWCEKLLKKSRGRRLKWLEQHKQ
ncbi:GIY-YIG nuclease family protein [Pontiella sulfatireligans]|uniref:GIY-YIG nuclease family protein n=1 Tax=Pontiella sulfatireligans TaxID=2750658 RepID=UPI001444814C